MDTATLTDLLRCYAGIGQDPLRPGLVIDYRGDHPPVRLFGLLREYGWLTPVPHAPPARVIDWDRADPVSGRSWSLRPFMVLGALAVPGPETPAEATTVEWLEHTLDRVGARLAADQVHVGTLRETRPGRVVVPDADDVEPHDPFASLVPPRPPLVPVSAEPDPPALAHGPLDRSSVGPLETLDASRARTPPLTRSGHGHEATVSPLTWSPPDPAMATRTVWAVIRRGVLAHVVEVLKAMDLEVDTLLLPVSGVGRGGGRVTHYRGRASVEPLQRIQLQVPVDPDDVDELVQKLTTAARAGEKGDGKIWVT